MTLKTQITRDEIRSQLMTSAQVAAEYGSSIATLDRHLGDPHRGLPPPIEIADRRFWWRPDVEAFLASRTGFSRAA